jgi:hypothetical protein
MKSTQVNLGVIRDKQAIYLVLLKSKSLHRQLAVCFNSDGKLIVKICIVKQIIRDNKGSTVRVVSPDDTHTETAIPLDHIQSIYPILDFMQ